LPPVHRERAFPLDYRNTGYAYLERPNAVLLGLVRDFVLREHQAPRILDVGCGAGANGRALRQECPGAVLAGIEPNPQAAELAREVYDSVFHGTAEQWLESSPTEDFDAVLLSDILEHVVDPVDLLRQLAQPAALRSAQWVVSVPNYAVWYNRARALAGRFEYAWSGLYDRTHVRFFTRRSLHQTLRHCGFEVVADRCSPSLAQAAAPLLRLAFEPDLDAGHTLALGQSRAYAFYQRFVEPAETRVCRLWPELLGFQIVAVARVAPR
jgi:SAM-dependent methyltransferase